MTVDSLVSQGPAGDQVRPFDFLAEIDAVNAAAMLSTAADITLVITAEGIVCDRVIAGSELPPEIFIGWPGKAWVDTVTVESRPKIEELLQDAAVRAPSRWRQVNHPTRSGVDMPVRYSAMQVGQFGHVVATGRDMRAVATLQQRLIAAEQSIEEEHSRLRSTETRYRLLLQVASEAIMIVDAQNGRVVETNPAASSLLGKPVKRLVGALFQDLFDGADREKIDSKMISLRNSGRADDVAVTLGSDLKQAIVSSAVFRKDNSTHFLVRLIPLSAGSSGIVVTKAQSKVVKFIQEMPDGFVVTDIDRRILTANAGFLDIAQLGSEEQARGEPIESWLGRPGVDMNLMINSIKQRGTVRQFETILRGQFGTTEDVEVSGVSVADGHQPCYGFVIRRSNRRALENTRVERGVTRSVDELTKLVGKVPLKELVRETTDIIERLCIEAALQLNENNRASTADMLGLSRQSLYVKLHRHGIDDAPAKN